MIKKPEPDPIVGTVVVPCQRCGRTMRAEVAAAVSPIREPDMRELKITRGGETVGICYWRLKAVSNDHRCPGRNPLPRAA